MKRTLTALGLGAALFSSLPAQSAEDSGCRGHAFIPDTKPGICAIGNSVLEYQGLWQSPRPDPNTGGSEHEVVGMRCGYFPTLTLTKTSDANFHAHWKTRQNDARYVVHYKNWLLAIKPSASEIEEHKKMPSPHDAPGSTSPMNGDITVIKGTVLAGAWNCDNVNFADPGSATNCRPIAPPANLSVAAIREVDNQHTAQCAAFVKAWDDMNLLDNPERAFDSYAESKQAYDSVAAFLLKLGL